MYSNSIIDKPIEFYFLLDQDTREWSTNWHVLDMLFLSTLHHSKLASEYLTSSKVELF